MTVAAAQAELSMDVRREGGDGRFEGVIKLAMAIDAAVFLSEGEERGEERRAGEKAEGAEAHVIFLS
jgi:hypothetical protein